ncbi:MAG TPA: SIMPL domain-containing protein [Casimicrobiaceae bacterium]
MNRTILRATFVALATALALFATHVAHAQAVPVPAPLQPVVTVSASASASVATDRLQAWLRAEAESADPATAANQVNTAMAKALARVKGVPTVKAQTSGYSTQQIGEKRPTRWRVAQTLTVEGADFAAMATLITKLQDEDGLLVSGTAFSLSAEARRRAEEGLTQEAIRGWQERAERAAQGLGFSGWHPGHVTVQTGEPPRVFPMMRAQVSAASAAPVTLEPGNADVSVTVSGDAVLEGAPRR